MSVTHRILAGNSPAIPLRDRILVGEDTSSILLGVSKPVFRRWVADGYLHPVELPGNLRRKLYRRQDLEAFAAGLAAGDIA